MAWSVRRTVTWRSELPQTSVECGFGNSCGNHAVARSYSPLRPSGAGYVRPVWFCGAGALRFGRSCTATV